MLRVASLLQRISKISNSIGAGLIVLLLLMTMADIFLRIAFNSPIRGEMEFSGFTLAIIVWLGFAYTMQVGGHIKVTLITSRFSPRTQILLDTVACLVGVVLLVMVALSTFRITLLSWQISEFAEVSRFPIYPVKAIVFAGASLFLIELLTEIFLNLAKLKSKRI